MDQNTRRPETTEPESQELRQGALAPETHNDEQDEHRSQAQQVALDAMEQTPDSPTESIKDDNDSGLMDDSTQDLVDHMRDMESSGRIDMSAYRGEDNHDDNEDKYGAESKLDDLPSDGTDDRGNPAD